MMTSQFASHVVRLLSVAAVAVPLAVHATPAGASPAPAAEHQPDSAARYVVPMYILDGKPDMDPGQDMGYWVWRDQDGIHLRTTTRGHEHDFNGVIRTSDGSKLTNVDRAHLRAPGQQRRQSRGGGRPPEPPVPFRYMGRPGWLRLQAGRSRLLYGAGEQRPRGARHDAPGCRAGRA